MKILYEDLTKAWESINELFLDIPQTVLDEYQGCRVSSATYLYDFTFTVLKPVLDPNFDFGRHFNYTKSKWSNLVSNYVCLEELKELKALVTNANQSKKHYSLPYAFKNKHSNGKNCLLNMVITKRVSDGEIYVSFYLRASEITKRLVVDFLLAQRLGDFLLDHSNYHIVFHINQMFNDDTVLLMYHAHRPILKVLQKASSPTAPTLYAKLQGMLEGPESKYCKYKVHFRAFKVLRPDLYVYPVTLAKDCLLPQ